MNGKTKWFTPRQKPVRPGIYECVVETFDVAVLLRWHPYNGWPLKITQWRGLTVEEFMRRGGM
jgi:hypothetical protein